MAKTARISLFLCACLALSTFAVAQERGKALEIVRSGTAVDEPPRRVADREVNIALPEVLPNRGAKEPSPGARPIPLATQKNANNKSETRAPLTKPAESLITIGGSLCVVLSLFFGLAWLTRRGMPRGAGKLPEEVIELLGKSTLVKGQELQLVRVGAKLLLICVGPAGCETLTEITDDEEVDRLAAICRRDSPTGMTAAFNQVLTGLGRERASGFAGDPRTRTPRREVRYHA